MVSQIRHTFHSKKEARRICTLKIKQLISSKAISRIFPDCPSYLTTFSPAPPNASTSASSRREKDNLKLSDMESELFQSEATTSWDDLIQNLPDVCLPDGFSYFQSSDSIAFVLITSLYSPECPLS